MLAHSFDESFEVKYTMEDGKLEIDVMAKATEQDFDIEKWIDSTAKDLNLLRAILSA